MNLKLGCHASPPNDLERTLKLKDFLVKVEAPKPSTEVVSESQTEKKEGESNGSETRLSS